MRFKVLAKDLKDILYLFKFTEKDGDDILNSLLLELKSTGLFLTGRDISMALVKNIEILESQGVGRVIINSKVFSNIVRVIDMTETITCEIQDDSFIISTLKTSYKLNLIKSEYPEVRTTEITNNFSVIGKELVKALDKVSICIDANSNKIEYTGLKLELINKNEVLLNGFSIQRIAVAKCDVNSQSEDVIVNIPKKAITEISKIFYIDDVIEFNINKDNGHVHIFNETTHFYSKTIPSYPKSLKRFFEKEYFGNIVFNRKELLNSCKMVNTINKDKELAPIIMKIRDNVEITCISYQYGKASDIINPISCSISVFDLGINATQFIEILTLMKSETVELKFSQVNKEPFVLKNDNVEYLLMPVVFY